MYEGDITLNASDEWGCVQLWFYNENEGLFALSERIIARYEGAYMNGYNWAALIEHWVGQKEPALTEEIEMEPEAGSLSIRMEGNSAESVEKMTRLRQHILAMLADEAALMAYIEEHLDEIEWD